MFSNTISGLRIKPASERKTDQDLAYSLSCNSLARGLDAGGAIAEGS